MPETPSHLERPRAILWDIYEEHLDEAAFLWSQWERALDAANYTLSEVASGPEERLLAHLDALVVGGGPVAERLVLPALGDADPGRVSAAAWVLVQAEDADHFESVWQAWLMAKEPVQRRAMSRALQLSQQADLPRRLHERLQGAGPELKAGVLGAIAARGAKELSKVPLRALAAESHPELFAAVLVAMQRVPELSSQTLVEQGLLSEDVAVRGAAIEAATLLKIPSVRAVCRRLIAERAPDRRLALAVLALGDEPDDRKRLIEWSRAEDLAVDALWACGFTGRIDVAEFLLGRLEDEKLAPTLAESFSTITGLRIEGPFTQPGVASSLEPLDDEAPVPEPSPEDELPMPRVEPLRAWWQSNRANFVSGGRYLFGSAWSAQSVQAALSRSPTWRRNVLRLGLSVEGAAQLDSRTWARGQDAHAASRSGMGG